MDLDKPQISPRPYLIIPKFIIQPTWGGSYIAEMKGWQNLQFLKDKKIGQSYELFSGLKLATSITDTSDARFVPEIGFPDKPDVLKEDFNLIKGEDYIDLQNLGEYMPLLIKVNQSMGNAFQIHIKPGVKDTKWQHKAETWYYFEPGLATYGIKKGINLNEYKNICIKVDNYMQESSKRIKSGDLDLASARNEAKKFILQNDPHDYVNLYATKKYQVVDPSEGGIHHSWEEDTKKYPLGNVVYEVQEDIMDPIATVRCFDQGKIKDDGSVRELNIEDYFKYLDAGEKSNDIYHHPQNLTGETVIKTPYYSMDVVKIVDKKEFNTGNSFVHIFVRDGAVGVKANNISLRLTKGFSCFIPKTVGNFMLTSLKDDSCVLKTYLG